jgi:hypothetical protein
MSEIVEKVLKTEGAPPLEKYCHLCQKNKITKFFCQKTTPPKKHICALWVRRLVEVANEELLKKSIKHHQHCHPFKWAPSNACPAAAPAVAIAAARSQLAAAPAPGYAMCMCACDCA